MEVPYHTKKQKEEESYVSWKKTGGWVERKRLLIGGCGAWMCGAWVRSSELALAAEEFRGKTQTLQPPFVF